MQSMLSKEFPFSQIIFDICLVISGIICNTCILHNCDLPSNARFQTTITLAAFYQF